MSVIIKQRHHTSMQEQFTSGQYKIPIEKLKTHCIMSEIE